jgi:ABC-type uncharacterized transport system auxiliary subunit
MPATLRLAMLAAIVALLLSACAAPSLSGQSPADVYSIQNVGSDTMVNLALGAGRTIASDVAG